MQYRNNSRCYVCVHLVSASLFASVEIVAPIGLGAAWSFVLKTGYFFCLSMTWFLGLHRQTSSQQLCRTPTGSVNNKCQSTINTCQSSSPPMSTLYAFALCVQ